MDQSGIPLDTAAIVSTVLEGILYGFSIMMFIGTIWALTNRQTYTGVNRAMMMVSCLMLLLCTTHMVIDIIRTYEGLVEYRDTFQPDGPIGFFSDVSQWSFMAKNVIYTLSTLVGDGVVIYRCYVVWKSRWIVAFPIILWVSTAVTGFACVYLESQATVAKENVFAPSTGAWITAFLSDALFTNIFTTSLLAFRIWKGTRVRVLSSHTTVLWRVLRIILDAGMLYSASLIALLMCFVGKNRGHYVVLDMSVPIMSITFYMVIIRTTFSKPTSQDIMHLSSSGSGRLTFSRMPRPDRDREHDMQRTEVHITRLTETNAHEGYRSGSSELEAKSDEVTEGKAKVVGTFVM